MKKTILKTMVAAALGIGANSVYAAAIPVQFDPFGTSGAGAITIDVIDWAPGSALAQNGNNAIDLSDGQASLTLFAHSKLANLQFGGSSVTPAGIPELTFVAGFGEIATVVAPNTVSLTLDPANPTNFFEIWSGGAAANDLLGSGFNDGTLVMRGSIEVSTGVFAAFGSPGPLDSFGADDWAAAGFAQPSISGTGGSSITVSVKPTDINAAFFPTLPPEFNITLFNNSQVLLFNQVNPSECFTAAAGGIGQCDGTFNFLDAALGVANPDLGNVNAQTAPGNGPDSMFQQDANMSFSNSVPEPATLALLGTGLMGLGFSSLRNRRRNSAATA